MLAKREVPPGFVDVTKLKLPSPASRQPRPLRAAEPGGGAKIFYFLLSRGSRRPRRQRVRYICDDAGAPRRQVVGRLWQPCGQFVKPGESEGRQPSWASRASAAQSGPTRLCVEQGFTTNACLRLLAALLGDRTVAVY
jgi:hypothetical protein